MTKAPATRLTHAQFAALAQLTGMHQSPTAAALRDVLVNGARPVDAAPAHGISTQSLRQRLVVVRRKIALAKIVASIPPERTD